MSAAAVLVKAKKFSLDIVSGPHKGQKLHFSKPIIQIGRGKENDIILDQDPKVSRVHAEIKQENGKFILSNISERNILLLNGQIIRSSPLESSNRLLIGETEVVFSNEEDPLRNNNNVVPFVSPPSPSSGVTHSVASIPQPLLGAQIPGNSSAHIKSQFAPVQNNESNKLILYAVIGLLIIGAAWMFSSQARKNKGLKLRSNDEIELDIQNSKDNISDIEKKIVNDGKNDAAYQLAQQHYLKGFRDYRQGQYGRAVQSLQAAIAFYPQHDLAKRYLTLSKKKLDEVIRYEMNNGRKYKSQGNYRMCTASYRKVLIMIGDVQDQSYKEAQQFMKECDFLQKEHF